MTRLAVGGIIIVRRGDGSGHLTTTATCDPAGDAAMGFFVVGSDEHAPQERHRSS